MTQALRPLKRENLRDSVKRAIRSAIISGEMEPGRVYSAPTLGETFGVSPTPVREAMLDLVREGLVISLPNKGFRVTEVSESDLDDVAQLRTLIEPPMVRLVAGTIDAAGIERLREQAGKIVDAARAGDLIDYVSCDLDFHLTLLEHAGNRLLLDVVADLRAKTRLLGLTPLLESGRLVESAEEHLVIMDLVEAGRGEDAEAYLRRHIGHVRGLWAAQPEA
ncbi:GntR family transcriptional regulator [Microlunatus sp. GCM10028923]|uniref:GntR family transcriptional regulator n=1 Tax=Microlunatus sp. GCM10028923 TaxID=3273400 RepID=UPI00360D8FEE